MADNVTLNAGSGGATLAADDISGVKYPRTKIVLGSDGVNSGDISATNPMPVDFALASSGSGDGFGRVRTSEPVSIFEVTHQYDLAPRLVGLQRQDASTTITHTTPTAVLAVPAVSGRRICHQSHKYTIYQPGKSHLIRISGQLGTGAILAGMGYGDDDDGIFLERASTGLQIRFSSSTVADQLIAQADWNVDKFDGTGTSGIILDASKVQQLVVDLQWLAVGRVRVGLSVGGKVCFAHYFNFANIATTAFMRTASLPVRWYAESLGAAGSMTAICASVSSEGGHDPQGQLFSYALGTSKAIGTAGVRTPVLSIRPALLFNTLVNRGHIIPLELSAIATSADNILLEWVADGSLTGATFAVPVDARSHAEIDSAATAITGGRVLWADYISSQTRAPIRSTAAFDAKNRLMTLLANGTDRDLLTLCGTRIAGAASMFAGINWMETQ